jgi:hypothetical protein
MSKGRGKPKTRPAGARCESHNSRRASTGKHSVPCAPRHKDGRFAKIKDKTTGRR